MNYKLIITSILLSMVLPMYTGPKRAGVMGSRVVSQNQRLNRKGNKQRQRQERNNQKYKERQKRISKRK